MKRNRPFTGDSVRLHLRAYRESLTKSTLCMLFIMLLTSGGMYAQTQDRIALQQMLIAQKAAVEANPAAHSNQTRNAQIQDNALPQDICYVPQDPNTWSQISSFIGSGTGGGSLDDGSSALINLPFQFDFYGELSNSLYININGNVSFDEPYWEYSSTGFPISGFKMIAPFWADVDLRGAGEIWYTINSNSIYINWVGVGYFNSQTDLLNTFQLVLSDGTDASIGLGNNVAFHYGDMNWTTGAASGGEAGFGGTAATVGANYGNSSDFFSLGRFDRPGSEYTSSTSFNGVDYLDGLCPQFSVAGNQNLAPIAFGVPSNNLLELCPNSNESYTLSFASPEADQITHTEITGAFDGLNVLSNIDSQSSTIEFSVANTVPAGEYTFTLTATDNHPTNPQSTSVEITIRVNYELCPCLPILTVICPSDVTVECGNENNFDFTGMPAISGDFCNDTLSVVFDDVLISCTPCGKVISRTWIITVGNLSQVCTQVITSQDTQGPEIIGLESEINVQCSEEIPGFQEVAVVDACSGDGSIENWSSQTGEVESTCVASTAFGPGADWAIWLPTLSSASGANFVFNAAGGHFDQFTDGTAHMSGTVVNTVNGSEEFIVDLWFENNADWATWSGQGRNYKNDLLLDCATNNHQNWSYYELVGGFSTLTGAGSLEGTELYIYHMPASYYFGFQIGVGANNKNCANGMSGWFTYEGFMGANQISGHGDVNVDLECQPNLEQDCVNRTSFTYFYRGVDGCGNASLASQQINVDDTTAPVFSNCPESYTTECSLDSIPVFEGIEAIDNCSGDAQITYLGEATEGDACVTTLTRTWSATDLCGNRSECVQVITIVDTTAPVMGNLPAAEITVECDAVPAAAEVTLVDNCDQNPTLVYNEERIDGNCPSNYTLVRTWSGYDQCENAAVSFIQTINVQDTTAPAFDPYEFYAHIECDQIPNLISATDNCGNATVELIEEMHQSGGCLGVLYRVYRATDECGNATEVEQYISIMDTTAPLATIAPMDTTIECGAEIPVYTPAFTDNCGSELELNTTSSSETIDCVTTVVEVYSATDYCGNTATVTRIITIVDTTLPTFTSFPVDLSISCEENIPAVEMPTAIDICDSDVSITYTEEMMGGNCPQSYSIVRTFVATDDCGNSVTQAQSVFVMDETAPVFVEQENMFTYECNTEIPVVTPSASDNCGTVEFSYEDSEMEGNTCAMYLARVWTAADECGNTSLFTQNISIIDSTAPVISGENQIDRPCDDYAGIYVQVAENCNEYNVTFTDEMVSGSCAGNVIRHYFATDDCGNISNEFTQIIHRLDEVAPMVVSQTENFTAECGGVEVFGCDVLCNPDFESTQLVNPGNWGLFNQTSVPCWMAIGSGDLIEVWGTGFDGVAAYSGLQFIELNSVSPSTVYQNFTALPGATVAISFAHRGRAGNDVMKLEIGPVGGPYVSLGNFSAGTTQWNVNTVNYTFPSNSSANYAIRFNAVSSAGGPSVGNFIDNVSMCIVDDAQTNNEVLAPVFADNCDNELEIDSAFTSVTEGCTTIETYTWTASDQCGNSTTATTVVTLVDNTDPYFTALPENMTVSCDDSEVGFGAYSAADNCDNDVTVSVTDQILEGDCPQSYTIERTYRAADNCGNQAVETRYVYVLDQNAPAFEEQDASFTYECGEEIEVVEPIASDNCGLVSLDYSDTAMQGTSCIGLIIREWIATDECGNNSTFNQYISITDTQAPVVNAYETEIEMACDNVSEEITITVTDCSETFITFSDEYVSGTCAGRIIRSYTISDACGNITSGLTQQIINLIDVTAPTVDVAPADVILECGEVMPSYEPIWSDNCTEELSLNATSSISQDNCTTVITQNWSAADPCGNATTVSRTITIVDSSAPVFTSVPENEERDCNADDVVASAFADDICSDVTITRNDVIVAGLCSASYTIERTYTATDVCGNFATYTQVINVSDNNGPVWGENQTSFVYECGSDAEVVTPVAFDDCSEFTVNYANGESFELGCTSAFERIWTATDACGNQSITFIQYISFEDNEEPVLSGCPADLILACNDNLPAPAEISAFDSCDDNVEVYYEQTFLGDGPAEGSIADCNLITPIRPATIPCGYPTDWSMVMFGMLPDNRYYTVDGGSLVQYPDNTIHLTATMRSTTNPSNGWNVDVMFAGNMDWETWSNQNFPTSFKDDCGGVSENHPSWHYFLMTPGANAELTGFGNFVGSMVNLSHAPSNNYFGFQLGDGANNYNDAENGFGGWFSYSGVFRNTPNAPFTNVTGSGDFAFELDCCPDYQIVREWTAIDCSGNTSSCVQNISFSSSVPSNEDVEGSDTNFDESATNQQRENAIGAMPNPTNHQTTFTFKVATSAKTSFEVLDMTGKKVADLYSGNADAGTVYTIAYDVKNLAPGVYMFRLINGIDVKIDRLIVSK